MEDSQELMDLAMAEQHIKEEEALEYIKKLSHENFRNETSLIPTIERKNDIRDSASDT